MTFYALTLMAAGPTPSATFAEPPRPRVERPKTAPFLADPRLLGRRFR